MPARARTPFRSSLAPALAAFALCLACGRAGTGAAADADARSGASVPAAPVAVADLSSGPAWFEFSASGPVRTAGPLESALVPFAPWPLARRAAGVSAAGSAVSVAVNGDGCVILLPREGGLVLYRAPFPPEAAARSIASVFSADGLSAVLFYRDRFFRDPVGDPPDPRTLALERGRTVFAGLELPPFSSFPAADGWDIDAFARAADGCWLLRAVKDDGRTVYARAPSLADAPTELTAAAYRAALLPRSRFYTGGALRNALEAASLELLPGAAAVVAVVRRDGEAAENLLASRGDDLDAEAVLFRAAAGVERLWAYADEERSYLLYPDGAYFAATADSPFVARGRFPALPDGFAYAGIAAVGETLVAFWEEQDGLSVGSAGLVAVPR